MLRREGRYKDCDLNKELADFFISLIAKDWRSLFSSKFFDDEAKPFLAVLDKHLNDVISSVPLNMEEDARKFAETAHDEAKKDIAFALMKARDFANKEQKNISWALSQCVKDQLEDAYTEVMKITGFGSIKKQKVSLSRNHLHNYLWSSTRPFDSVNQRPKF